MNKTLFKTKLVPLLALILCCILYLSGYFQNIIAVFLILIASAIEYKKGLFKSLGFQRKGLKIKNLLIIAPLISGALFLLYYFILIPSVTHLTGQAIDFSVFEPYKGNLSAILNLLILIWLSAAFGEEILYRGYLMRQFIKFFGNGKISIVINILLFGIIFGWMHAYQGVTGQIISGIIGALLAVIFHIRKYDLWFNIAIHGFFDTIALVFIYYGVF
jgi:membrane protease YdiL (CAAX protease family)